MARAKRLGKPLALPEIGAGAYLLEAMFRIGPVRETGLNTSPPDWSEIDAFARQTGRISEPWEAEALFDMCQGYLEEIRAGENPLVIPPVERDGRSRPKP